LTPAELAATAVRDHHAIQQPEELTRLISRLRRLRPLRTVIEIGCDAGGTLWAWRQVCPVVYGITLPVSPPGEGLFPQGRHPLETHGALVHLGDSHDAGSVFWLGAQLGFGKQADFLFIDGDHSPEGVLADFEDYRHLVRPGGLIALDDVLNPDLDVRKAWTHITSLPLHTEVISAGKMPAGIGLVHAPA
jgi:cephalosporin hydroxylase